MITIPFFQIFHHLRYFCRLKLKDALAKQREVLDSQIADLESDFLDMIDPNGKGEDNDDDESRSSIGPSMILQYGNSLASLCGEALAKSLQSGGTIEGKAGSFLDPPKFSTETEYRKWFSDTDTSAQRQTASSESIEKGKRARRASI